jgi:hypothetical protein
MSGGGLCQNRDVSIRTFFNGQNGIFKKNNIRVLLFKHQDTSNKQHVSWYFKKTKPHYIMMNKYNSKLTDTFY